MSDVLDLIKNRMDENHMSLESVAQRIGVSRQSVWAVLNRKATATQKGRAGARETSFSTIRKILDAVGLETGVSASGSADPDKILRVAGETGISLSTLEKLLAAAGFELTFREKEDFQ